jgi:hypothetical protein
MPVGGNYIPEPLTVQLALGDGFAVVAIVADDVFAEGISQHLVHVNGNSLHP